jgi:SHS2 domain-containing protein
MDMTENNHLVPKYEVLDHTADLRLRIYGYSFEDLLNNAALGLFECIGNISEIEPGIGKKIHISGSDMEEILVNYLNELLYLLEHERFFPSVFIIVDYGNNRVLSKVFGEYIDAGKQTLKLEVKSTTYHNLKIECHEELYQTDIVFDL